MKLGGIFIAIATVAIAPAVAQERKAFDFMGYVAGEVIPASKLKGCGKGADATCLVPLAEISSVSVGYLLKTHDYRLSSVFIDANPGNYQRLLEAFTAKYGEPCERVEAVWKNAAGAVLSNPTLYWCFSSGKLMFARYGARIDRMGILYQDKNAVPTAEPVINF